jgi:tripartite-type tricarboxylate transporter receptor subunit TctC
MPISGVIEVAQAYLVKGDAPWNSLKDLWDFSRQNPGIKIATLGKTHLSYLYTVLVTKQENVTFASVPFDGGSKMVPAILGGHVLVGITGMDPTLKSLLDAKRLKALAICLKKRIDILPEVPSLEELGYKLPLVSISGVFGPKGLPEDVAKRIDEVVRMIVADKDFRAKVYTTTAQVNYLDAASYERSLAQYRDRTHAFFKEEGMVK